MINDSLLVFLAAALVFFTALPLFYWIVVQPVLLQKRIYYLFALRDRLRMAIIDGSLDKNNKHVQMLEDNIGAIVANASTTSYFQFIMFCFNNRKNEVPDEIKSFCLEAPELVKEINGYAIRASFDIMLINSPLLNALVAVAVFAVALIKPPLTAAWQTTQTVMGKSRDSGHANAFISKMPAPAH